MKTPAKSPLPSPEPPPWLRVKHALWTALRAGEFGTTLPAERALAERYGVSYLTLRRAIGALVQDGLLVRSHGKRITLCSPADRPPTGAIGLIFDPSIKHLLANEFYSEIVRDIYDHFDQRGLAVCITSRLENLVQLDEPEFGQRVRQKIDGALVVGCSAAARPDLERLAKILPTVLCNSELIPGIPSFHADDVGGMRALTRLVTQIGHRRLGLVAGPEASQVARSRTAGWREALAEAGIPATDAPIVEGDFSSASGYHAAATLRARNPKITAIMCANDAMAFGALRRLADDGVRVPDDCSVTGFDDLPLAAQSIPSLSTVSVSRSALAQRACHALAAMLQGLPTTGYEPAIPAQVILRRSVASPRGTA